MLTTLCRRADYRNDIDRLAVLSLMDCYANDPMGGAELLSADVRERLCDALAEHPGALSIIAWQGDRAVGLINTFLGFSTFKARPLMNIHDVIVRPENRRQGIAALMLDAVASEARQQGCCKLTLEVLEGNRAARQRYLDSGFVDYQLKPEFGVARFMEKAL